MNARLNRIKQQIAALEEEELRLKMKQRRGTLSLDEEAELSLLPSKLDSLAESRKTLVTALATATAPTQGIFDLIVYIRINISWHFRMAGTRRN